MNFASFTGLQAKDIICGSTCSEYNPYLSMWDKRITLNFKARFLPNVLYKTQHSVYSVVHGKRPHHKQAVSFLIIFRKMLVSAVEGLHSTALWINKSFMWIISLQLCLLWVGLILISNYIANSLVLSEKTSESNRFSDKSLTRETSVFYKHCKLISPL